jgi:hypothetical protein
VALDFGNDVNYPQALIYRKISEYRIKMDSINTKVEVENNKKKGSPF